MDCVIFVLPQFLWENLLAVKHTGLRHFTHFIKFLMTEGKCILFAAQKCVDK
jgi:hypothetical protein